MNHSPSPNQFSPSGHINRSLLSPDPHDSNSNHSEQFAAGDSTPTSIITNSTSTADHDNHIVPKKKDFKTEYKSKFTPFDQYVYNEVTDSFVKHSLEPSITHGQNRAIPSSRSNQDLSNTHENSYQPSVTISTQGADVFSPSNEGANDNSANNEPWYKEVVRRNKKANEYRFKSEIGHNSPLSNYNNSHNTVNNLRVESPYNNLERQTASPTGAESIVGDLLTTSDARSQNSDPQNESVGSQQEPKQQFKFTPNDYKRDHLISRMANNNNFNLPKEQFEHSTHSKQSSRHTQVSTSARPASRTGAQIRSRSQSTRRQPFSTTAPSTTTSKGQSITAKSNQTTPTRTVTQRTAVRSHVTPTTQAIGTKSPVKNTLVNSRINSARPTTASPRTVTNLKQTPKEPVKRSPISSNSATKATTPRSTNGTSTQTIKMKPSSTGMKRTTAAATTRVTSTPRPTAPRSANTPGIAAGRLPKTNVSAPSTRVSTTATSSRNKSTESSKPSASPATQNNAVKSIKTPKAIAAAKEAGVAAVAATAAASAASSEEVPESFPDYEINNSASRSAFNQDLINESETQPNQERSPSSTQTPPPERLIANSDSSNQKFSSRESGNMLSDELAQAERESNFKTKAESLEQQVTSFDEKPKMEDSELDKREVEKVNEGLNSNELFNGLAGGLVSAEDRFDSSEKETSSEMNAGTRQLSSDNNFYNHHDTDEPYSIIPTSSQRTEVDNFTNEPLEEDGTNSEVEQDKEGNIEKNLDENLQLNEPLNTIDIKESEHDELETFALEQPETYDVNDSKRRQSSKSSSDDLSDKIDHHNEPTLESGHESERLSERHKAFKEGNSDLESTFDRLNIQNDKSSGTDEEQALKPSLDVAPSHQELQLVNSENKTDLGIQNQRDQIWDDNSNESFVYHAVDKKKDSIDNYDTNKESDNEDSPALVEDFEQQESSSPKRQKLSESSKKLEGEENDNDVLESRDFNESTPALASANTTLQEAEFNTSAAFGETPYNNNGNKNISTNLVREALNEVETSLHDGIVNKQLQDEQISLTKEHEFIEFQQSESKNVEVSNRDDLEENMNRNELLMSVTDLIESESRKKMEMARKSEIARQNMSPQSPLSQSEILLSADQLTADQSIEQPNKSSSKNTGIEVNELRQPDTGKEEHGREDNESDSSENSSLKIENIPRNQTNLESSSAKMSENSSSVKASNLLEDISDQEDDDSKSDKRIVNAFERAGHKEMDINTVSGELSNVSISDDIDNDEQLKLSNPLTNSDDELILQPRNYNYSSPRYNEGIGLEMMSQEEDRLNGSVELGDGSSAAIEKPTVAENRLEMLASKSIVPEISQTNYLFSRTEDSDEEVVDTLDSEKDLIDAEATIGHAAIVDKDELLRFNEVKEKVLEDPNRYDSHDKQVGEIISAPPAEHPDNELDKDFMDSAELINVTSNVIDETVKQIQKHGELHRQLNKSQEERRYSSGLDERALRRQNSSDSSSSGSTSSSKVKINDIKSEYDEFVARMSADIISPKNENLDTTFGSNSGSQNEGSVLDDPIQKNEIESSETIRTATLLD